MGSKVIGCRLPDDLCDELSIRCEAEGVRVSYKLKQLVEEYMYPGVPRITVQDLYQLIEENQQDIMNIIKVLAGRGKVWIEDIPNAHVDPEIGVAPIATVHWEIE